MDDTANDTQPSPASDRSTADLVRLLSEQVAVLVRDELKLAQLEMTRKGKRAGAGVGMLGSGGLVALYGVGCLLAAAIIAIAGAVAAWLAALIVGAALLAMAAAVALLGRSQLKKASPPVPQEAVGSIQTDVEEIRERARR
ncbi:MAG TPA: phage holin family protein [Streptosporangiaceae bacterium]|nr:phage holin family protein [Streptosporangiaceae bacterium]